MKIAHILGAVCAITVELLSLHGVGVAQTVTSGQPIVIGTASPGGPYLAYGRELLAYFRASCVRNSPRKRRKRRHRISCCLRSAR